MMGVNLKQLGFLNNTYIVMFYFQMASPIKFVEQIFNSSRSKLPSNREAKLGGNLQSLN